MTAAVALALIRGYKLLVSPYFAGSCRFLPSCADYARDAIVWHGALAGSWLALRRLLRCHPLCAGGHDPVPPPAGASYMSETSQNLIGTPQNLPSAWHLPGTYQAPDSQRT